jgi:hypothetical protein
MAVTIHNLEVQFDVEGEGDEAVFAKLFAKYVNRWCREHKEDERRERLSEMERSLGDRKEEEM